MSWSVPDPSRPKPFLSVSRGFGWDAVRAARYAVQPEALMPALVGQERWPWTRLALGGAGWRDKYAGLLAEDAWHAGMWRAAVARGLRVPPTLWPDVLPEFSTAREAAAWWEIDQKWVPSPGELVGRQFSDLPDPFPPLFTVWERGYVLASVTEKAIVLVAPEVRDDE